MGNPTKCPDYSPGAATCLIEYVVQVLAYRCLIHTGEKFHLDEKGKPYYDGQSTK